jgi:hypothetical protein
VPKVTVSELAKEMEVEYAIAAALMRLLVLKGIGKEVGKKLPSTGKGRASAVYEIPASCTVELVKSDRISKRGQSPLLNNTNDE